MENKNNGFVTSLYKVTTKTGEFICITENLEDAMNIKRQIACSVLGIIPSKYTCNEDSFNIIENNVDKKYGVSACTVNKETIMVKMYRDKLTIEGRTNYSNCLSSISSGSYSMQYCRNIAEAVSIHMLYHGNITSQYFEEVPCLNLRDDELINLLNNGFESDRICYRIAND